MADATTIIDNKTVAANGGTVEGTFDVKRSDQAIKLYIGGDSNSTKLTVDLLAQPDEFDTYFYVDGTEKADRDLTKTPNNASVIQFDYRPADRIKVTLTNTAGTDTTVTVQVKKYLSV